MLFWYRKILHPLTFKRYFCKEYSHNLYTKSGRQRREIGYRWVMHCIALSWGWVEPQRWELWVIVRMGWVLRVVILWGRVEGCGMFKEWSDQSWGGGDIRQNARALQKTFQKLSNFSKTSPCCRIHFPARKANFRADHLIKVHTKGY